METLKKNKSIPDTTIEFTALDKDLYSSFHGAEIKNIFVDSEENLNFRIEDYYNFNPNRTSLKGRIGEKLQNNGFLKPYYIITVLKLQKKSDNPVFKYQSLKNARKSRSFIFLIMNNAKILHYVMFCFLISTLYWQTFFLIL